MFFTPILGEEDFHFELSFFFQMGGSTAQQYWRLLNLPNVVVAGKEYQLDIQLRIFICPSFRSCICEKVFVLYYKLHFLIFPGRFTFSLFHRGNPFEIFLAFFCEDIDGFVQGDVAMLQLSANVTMVEHYDITLPKTNMASWKILISILETIFIHGGFSIAMLVFVFWFWPEFSFCSFWTSVSGVCFKQEVDGHRYWMMHLYWLFHQLLVSPNLHPSWSLFFDVFPNNRLVSHPENKKYYDPLFP